MNQTSALLKANVKPELIRVSNGMPIMKPLCVEWAWNSWKVLRENSEVIASGWKRMGFDKLLDLKFQNDSMKLILNQALNIYPLLDTNPIDKDGNSWSDRYEIEEEDSDEDVDEKDTEANTDILLVQLINEIAVDNTGKSLRRSTRISQSNSYQSSRVAQIQQEQVYQEGIDFIYN